MFKLWYFTLLCQSLKSDACYAGAWPWLVALGYKSSPSTDVKFLCGSALITRRHVVTAGHCVHGRKDL